jgi:hypothetical protein
MATYYKYAERNADSQVNWAEVGQDVTDMLKAETKIREEKKGAIQKAFQDDMENLSNAPQGKWQDGNDTVNNFAHDMMGQKLMDKRLLESGQMKPRDYTLRSNNYSSQTNSLFELQTLLQNERQNTIDLYQKGEIQALNISNQADVEAYKNFKNSKVIISPYDANISMGLYEDEVVNGKTVRVLKKSTPVNVLKGQIVQKVPTLKIDELMDKYVPTVGKELDYLYTAATNSKAGSIITLMGVGSLENLEKEHPELKGKLGQYQGVIDKFNSALDQKVKSWLPTPYQVSSILTENTGNYSADSFVWDENIAKADKTKILKKIDPLTGLVTLDENAPHYKEQKKEAEDWVRASLLSKFDKERKIQVTPQAQLQERRAKTDAEFGNERAQASAKVLGEKIAHITTGTPEQVQAALDYFDSIPGVKTKKTKDSITVYSTNKEGDSVTNTYDLTKDGKFVNPGDVGKSLGKLYNVDKLPEDILGKYIDQFTSGKKVNTITEATGGKTTTIEQTPQTPIAIYSQHIDKTLTPAVIPEKATEVEVKNALNEKLNDIGITVSSSLLRGNSIYLKNNDGKESPVFNLGNKKEAMENMKKWIKSNPSKNLKDLIQSGVVPSGTGGETGAPAPNAQGVGSKYGG